ncbi:MAG TPA: hypothetical protein VG754_04740 [Verrucomicrobiae bacterium]|jgi:hypothetical protein|nr:hypothetical protein [Verrucomicrobiae bacterium]
MERDAEHLKLLSMFHYIRGGICAVFSCFFAVYIVAGMIIAMTSAFSHARNAPPPALGLVLALAGGCIVLVGWTWGALQIYAGHCLAQRKHRMYCMVIAGLSCLFIPYGTLLGIFTLMVLQRPSVRQTFEQPPAVK